jgi:hypothetical protein
MAYLMLVLGLGYSTIWGMGLFFSAKSDGPKNTIVPVLGLLAFLGLSGVSAKAAINAMDTTQRLTTEAYMGLAYNQSLEDVEGRLGKAIENPDRTTFNLTTIGIVIPGEISARLPSGENSADAIAAKMVLTIIGEPGKRNQRKTLGGKAANEGNGLSGLQIVLKENETEVTFTEGEEWTYENGDTPEAVAKKIGEAIDAHESWTAEGSSDIGPTKVIIESTLEVNIGALGNKMEGWVATGANTSVKVGIVDNGSAQKFRGGMDSVTLKFWLEKEAVLDGNFSMTDRLVLVGFIDDKLRAVRQSGLDMTVEQRGIVQGGIKDARIAEEDAIAAEKLDQALKEKQEKETEEK